MQAEIQRYTDATHLNSILNHPEVRPFVAGLIEGPLDLTPAMSDENVVVLLGEYGGQVYQRIQPGVWEAHSSFLPEGRGEWAIAATRSSLKWMFTRSEAVEILTRCPTLAAKALAKSIGGVHDFTLPEGWVINGNTVPADVYSLTIQGWMKSAPDLPSRGKWFHARLNAEFDRLGISEPQHPESEIHDRYVGAACEMILAGQPDKACIFYNRIAGIANWQPIWVVNYDPLAINIGSAVIVVNGDDFFVIPPPKAEAAE